MANDKKKEPYVCSNMRGDRISLSGSVILPSNIKKEMIESWLKRKLFDEPVPRMYVSEIVKVQPMELPSSRVFLDSFAYTYGDDIKKDKL